MEIDLDKSDNNEKELLEIILQFLYENKYIESAKLLESKANIIYDQNEILNLKILLKEHKFDEAIQFLHNSNFENIQKGEVLKILKTRKFLQLVEHNKIEALNYLRSEITPLFTKSNILNKYSILLFQREEASIERNLKSNFSEVYHDENLINKVQSMLCLSLDSAGNRILPNSRLEKMLSQSLLTNEDSTKTKLINQFNKLNKQFLIEKNDDEVWQMDVSNSGEYLATMSRNSMMAIFSLNSSFDKLEIKCINYFLTHKKYVTSLQWSKWEKQIITSSADKSIKLWDPFEGKCLKTFNIHSDIVSSVKWLKEDTFVSGGIDKKMLICNTNNRIISSDSFSRIRRILVCEALNCIIIIPASLNDVILYDYESNREIDRISELDPIVSSNISKTDYGRFLITNLSKVNSSINLYDLKGLTLINKFYGHSQEQYTVECSFAGRSDEFIICGSEDASIFIWHRSDSIPLHVVKGHTGSVNSCQMLFFNNLPFIVSTSDDQTIRVFSEFEVDYEDLTNKKKKEKTNDVFCVESMDFSFSDEDIEEQIHINQEEHSDDSYVD